MLICYENADLYLKLKDLGAFALTIFSFIVGNIFYAIYRILIYSTLIIRLKDKLFKDQRYYSRTYFKAKLGCSSTSEANNFYYFIKSQRTLKALTRESSSVHLMYMTSIILFFYSVLNLFQYKFNVAILFSSLSVILGIAAFYTDRFIEKFDYVQIKNIPETELLELWGEFKRH